MRILVIAFLFLLPELTAAWSSSPLTSSKAASLRRQLATASLLLGVSAVPQAQAAMAPSSWDPNVQIETLIAPKADAKSPKVGDMVAVRFRGSFNGNTFDDTFKTDQPYFYRTGVGLILKGLDDTIVNMKEGEKVAVSFGGDLAFPNGKPSSPGKPRIPAGATLSYEVLLEALPGQGDPDALILD